MRIYFVFTAQMDGFGFVGRWEIQQKSTKFIDFFEGSFLFVDREWLLRLSAEALQNDERAVRCKSSSSYWIKLFFLSKR